MEWVLYIVYNTGLSKYINILSYSNGFKFRDTSQARNGTNYDFIYMAWAEAPIVGSNNVPCTAR